jgi:hypothetical protein
VICLYCSTNEKLVLKVQEIFCVAGVCMIGLINFFGTSRSHSADHQAPHVEKYCYRPLLLALADTSIGRDWILDLSVTSARAITGLEPGACINLTPSAVGQSWLSGDSFIIQKADHFLRSNSVNCPKLKVNEKESWLDYDNAVSWLLLSLLRHPIKDEINEW